MGETLMWITFMSNGTNIAYWRHFIVNRTKFLKKNNVFLCHSKIFLLNFKLIKAIFCRKMLHFFNDLNPKPYNYNQSIECLLLLLGHGDDKTLLLINKEISSTTHHQNGTILVFDNQRQQNHFSSSNKHFWILLWSVLSK